MEMWDWNSKWTVAWALRAQLTMRDPEMDQLLTVETSLVLAARRVVVVRVMSSTNHEFAVTSGVGLRLSALEMKIRLL